MYIEHPSIIMTVRIDDNTFIKSCSIDLNRCCKNIGIIASALPVLFVSNLTAVFNNFRNCAYCRLFCCAVTVLNCSSCTFCGQFYCSKFRPLNTISERIKISCNIRNVFFSACAKRDFRSLNDRCRFHLLELCKIFIHLLNKGIFTLVQLKPHSFLFRRALGLEGCGVFFCRPQVVHGLFCVSKYSSCKVRFSASARRFAFRAARSSGRWSALPSPG